jgi:hypothetical protein
MGSFSEHDQQRVDWKLFQSGAIVLYYREEWFDEDARWLAQHDYVVHHIDCGQHESFQAQMSAALSWSQLFSLEGWNGNLNALNDGFRHLEIPAEGGMAFCFKQFNLIKREDPQWAQGILDVIQCASYEYLLLGKRLLALVQSNNPRIHFGPVGAHTVQWNPREWFSASRPES